MRYLIKFSYDGSNFFGYQKQPNKRTIEGCFEDALFKINNSKYTKITASGRTDRGVHAFMQTAHFDLDISITPYKLKCALNSNLPDDIHVICADEVDENFHARYNVKYKIYEYYINIGEYDPIKRNYIYQYNRQLDITAIKDGIKYFEGKHNFINFVSKESRKENYDRIIFKTSVVLNDNLLKISFKGNGFMKYQVRNMVGTLLKVGKGRLKPDDIKNILDGHSNLNHVSTIGSEGLYLKEVKY